jgi:rhodanese-related sulfurtransferase
LAGKVLIFDAQTMQSRIIKLGTTTQTHITALTTSVAIPSISVAALKQNMDAYELVDVRTIEEHKAFNIGGRHVPVSDIDNLDLNNNTATILYCASGKRSAEAVKRIISKHPSAIIFSLEGGLKAWQEAG